MASEFDALQHIRETLALLDDPATALTTVARRCLRLAHLRGDWQAVTWLELELHEFGGERPSDHGLSSDLLRELGRAMGDPERIEVVKQFMSRRTYDAHGSSQRTDLVAYSIEALEDHLKMLDREIEINSAATVGSSGEQSGRDTARVTFGERRRGVRSTLAKTRNALHAYLLRTERELVFVQFNDAFFARTKALVDRQLWLVSPEAVERFNAAYSRLRDGDSESLSQAAASCRRVLHALADAVCTPRNDRPTDSRGKQHDLTADKYRNRLMWFVYEDCPKTTMRPLLDTDIELMAARLEALDSLGSKGVHDVVTAQEAEALASHVYLLAAEVLNLHERYGSREKSP